MGGVESDGVNNQPSSKAKSFWNTILECLDLNLLKILEDTPGDLSEPQGVQLLGEHVRTPQYFETDENKLKKKMIDKDYRQRVKEKKQKLALEVEHFDIKNARLRREIGSYQQDIDLMIKDLQTKTDERGELRASIDKLQHDIAKGKEFVSRLCSEPSIQKDVLECPVQLQIALLKNVHAVLDQNYSWEYKRKCLEEEITKLESDNKMLQVQHQALLESIHKTRPAKRIKRVTVKS